MRHSISHPPLHLGVGLRFSASPGGAVYSLGWTSRTMRKFILQRNVDVNVDRHFLLQRGHVLLGSGPEELSVSVGVWHVCQWKNFNELYASCLGTSFCKRFDLTPDFVVQIDAGNYILEVCIFRHLDRKYLVFPNVMDYSHKTRSSVDLHFFFFKLVFYIFLQKYLTKFTVKQMAAVFA